MKSNYVWIVGSDWDTGKIRPGRVTRKTARELQVKTYEEYKKALEACKASFDQDAAVKMYEEMTKG